MWRVYLKAWNGISMLFTLSARGQDETVTTDGSRLRGCGEFWQIHWFQQQWDSQEAFASQCIAAKVMLPILLPCAIWGKHWYEQRIPFQPDNKAVPRVVRIPPWCTCSVGCFSFRHTTPFHTCTRVLTIHCMADALSQNYACCFSQRCSIQKRLHAVHIPQKLMEPLVIQ